MKTAARITNDQGAWNRFLRFVALIEQSMDRDFVTPLYRRLDALEREVEELRGGSVRAPAQTASEPRTDGGCTRPQEKQLANASFAVGG